MQNVTKKLHKHTKTTHKNLHSLQCNFSMQKNYYTQVQNAYNNFNNSFLFTQNAYKIKAFLIKSCTLKQLYSNYLHLFSVTMQRTIIFYKNYNCTLKQLVNIANYLQVASNNTQNASIKTHCINVVNKHYKKQRNNAYYYNKYYNNL